MGELAAERWFADHGWHMVRTQPPVKILGMISPAMAYALKRFIPRLATFGHMVVARLEKGGQPDYTGYCVVIRRADPANDNMDSWDGSYRACEVKECAGDSMPASRLDKEQRAFMIALPKGCAWTGIFWIDTQKFTMHEFLDKGAYRRS
jgi:hypothetical protein